jgi:GT2 family glycosyltransferase
MPRPVSRVDLVIPTLNASDLLARCLDSLTNSTYRDFNLIVVDDGSTENIPAVVRPRFPEATIVRNERNIGLTRGFNQGIAAGSSEFVVLLNNDTEAEPRWLAELVGCADRHPEAGSVASKIRLMSDRGRLHSAGDYFSVRGMPGNRGVWMDDFGQYDREEELFAACAGAALYRRSALDAVARSPGIVFDERLFMYCEDIDLAWRLQSAEYRCFFCPAAVVYHELSATGGGLLASFYVNRNIWLVLKRSVPSGVLTPYRSRIAAHHVGRIVRNLQHIREPAARAALRGTVVGLAMAAVSARCPTVHPQTVERLRRLLHEPAGPIRWTDCYTSAMSADQHHMSATEHSRNGSERAEP